LGCKGRRDTAPGAIARQDANVGERGPREPEAGDCRHNLSKEGRKGENYDSVGEGRRGVRGVALRNPRSLLCHKRSLPMNCWCRGSN